jgi:hypothetical protein
MTCFRYILFILIYSSVITSCIKPKFDGKTCEGNCFELRGLVKDTPGGNSIRNVEIKIYFAPFNIYNMSGTQYIGVTHTDEEGLYRFKFDAKDYLKKEGGFRIYYSGARYFDENDSAFSEIFLDPRNIDKPFFQNRALYNYAFLKVHFLHVSTGKKSLFFSRNFNNISRTVSLGYETKDTTIILPTAGDMKTYIYWQSQENGIAIQEKKDTVFVSSKSEKHYEILY